MDSRSFLLVAASAAAIPAAATAQSFTLTPLAEVRARHEHAMQDGLREETSDAVTVRVRSGVQAAAGHWSALIEAQGNLAIVDDYFDGLRGPADRPLVADPQSIGLYRAQVQYRNRGVTLTGGRQRIAIDDERFVGTAAIRNNGQTFDAIRAELSPAKGVKADLTFAWGVRTVWGIDGRGARQQAVSGDNVFANLGWASPVGTLTGFAYLIDQDEAIVQNFRLSSQTYGARLAGTRPLGKAKLAYQASYARQSDYRRNPNDYAVDYYVADLGIDLNGPKLGAGYEVLGASNGAALTSFQTPLAAVFKFNGWAEKFTTKPADGLRDLYANAGWGWKQIGPFKAVSVQAIYHRFESDRLVRHYGNEIDLLATARLRKTAVSIRYADYHADRFATDTRKLWLQLDWTI